jgi:hypothetical protein
VTYAAQDAWIVARGLGSEDAVSSIHVGWKTMNSLPPPSDYGRDCYQRFTTTRTEEIQIRRLDGVMEKALDGIDDVDCDCVLDARGGRPREGLSSPWTAA